MKMDIEGAEIEACQGMHETLRNNNAGLAIAAYHEVNGEQTYKVIVPWLERIGFDLVNIQLNILFFLQNGVFLRKKSFQAFS